MMAEAPSESASQTQPSRPLWSSRVSLWGTMLLFVLLCQVAELESFSFGEAALLALPAVGILAAAIGLVAGIRLRKPQLRLISQTQLLLLLLMFFLFTPAVNSYQRSMSQDRGDVIATALQKFKEQRGHYPDALENLIPRDLQRIPPTAMGLFRQRQFQYEKRSADFRLHFEAGFFLVSERGSSAGWVTDD